MIAQNYWARDDRLIFVTCCPHVRASLFASCREGAPTMIKTIFRPVGPLIDNRVSASKQ